MQAAGQGTDEAMGEKERSMDTSEPPKRNDPGEEQAKEKNWGIKRRAWGARLTPG